MERQITTPTDRPPALFEMAAAREATAQQGRRSTNEASGAWGRSDVSILSAGTNVTAGTAISTGSSTRNAPGVRFSASAIAAHAERQHSSMRSIKTTASARKLLKLDSQGIEGFDAAGLPIVQEVKDPYRMPQSANINFFVHGEVLNLSPRSLGLFTEESRIRQWCIWLTYHKWFDYFILLVILLNSITLALTDYSIGAVLPDTLQPDPSKGRNAFVAKTQIVFTVVFIGEAAIKIVAMGLFQTPGSYLRDSWNWLDFFVVVTSILESLPSVPKLSSLRVFRVLRPLRTMRVLPGMRILVASLLNSIPQLANVAALLTFVFFMFGILALQLLTGKLNARCRLTPYPVQLAPGMVENHSLLMFDAFRGWSTGVPSSVAALEHVQQVVSNRTAFPFCADDLGMTIPLDDSAWTVDTSPWRIARDCVWPVNGNDTFLCSPTGSGQHDCGAGFTCGSNYDRHGHARFTDAWEVQSALFLESLSWGFISFDNMLLAFLAIFQSITLEGWVDLMYMTSDAYNGVFATAFFTLLVISGAFFLLQLTLAVIWGNLEALQVELADEDKNDESSPGQSRRSSEDSPTAIPVREAANTSVVSSTPQQAGGIHAVSVAWPQHHGAPPAGSRSRPPALRLQPSDQSLVAEPAHQQTPKLTPVRGPQDRVGRTKVAPLSMTTRGQQSRRRFGDSGLMTPVAHTPKVAAATGSQRVFLKVRYHVYKFVQSSFVTTFIVLLIVLNTVVLALDQHPMDPKLEQSLETINLVLTLLFALEMVLKILALSLKDYLKDSFNVFDALIVMVSVVEIAISPPAFLGSSAGAESGGGVSALRTFRLVRVFKLAKSWVSLRMLLGVILHTITDVGNFILLLTLFMYIASLVGQQFFANRFHFDELGRHVPFGEAGYEAAFIPRANFDTLLWSFVSVFQMLTAENWNIMMLDAWKATGWPAVLYFVACVAVGNFILLNLFLAILLGNFKGLEEKTQAETERVKVREKEKKLLEAEIFNGTSSRSLLGRMMTPRRPPAASPGVSRKRGRCDLCRCRGRQSTEDDNSERSSESKQVFSFADEDVGSGEIVPETIKQTPTGTSLFFLQPTSRFRQFCWDLIHHDHFDHCVLLLIGVSSVLLAIDSPLRDPSQNLATVLMRADDAITVLFAIESFLKIVSYGLVAGKGAYLRDSWNVLDFTLVAVALVAWAARGGGGGGSGSLKSLKTLRSLRALRPLRVISRNPGMKLLVNALFRAVPSIINVLFVCMLFFLIFGIVGVNYFKGLFNECQGPAFEALTKEQQQFVVQPLPFADLNDVQLTWGSSSGYASATSKSVCTWLGAQWDRSIPQNFDNIFAAAGALYEMTTREAWMMIMYAGVDATEIDMQPIRNSQEGWIAFFCLFIVVGSFFTMNLFVGVVIDNFNRMKEEMGDNVLLTASQKEWVKMQEAIQIVRPFHRARPPSGSLAKFLFAVTHHEVFEGVIVTCIVLNTLSLSLEHFGQHPLFGVFLERINDFFAVVFTLEAIAKLIALGRRYFRDPWNRFDFCVVVGTDVGLLASWLGLFEIGGVATVARTFRVGRVVRLVHSAKSLRTLFNTLIVTLPSLANIGSLLFLLYFIYAVMGITLFANIGDGEATDAHANFRNFGVALLTLLRASTGESWNQIMADYATDQPGCTSQPEWNDSPQHGCGSAAAYPYFISFTLLVAFVMLNVFIAVILEGFSDMSEAEEALLSKEQLSQFASTWAQFDPEVSMFIMRQELASFIEALPRPLCVTEGMTAKEQNQLIASLKMPAYAGPDGQRVHFLDIAKALGRIVFVASLQQRGLNFEEVPESHAVHRRWKKLKAKDTGNVNTEYNVEHVYAALTIRDTMATFRFRKRQSELGMRSPGRDESTLEAPTSRVIEGLLYGTPPARLAHPTKP